MNKDFFASRRFRHGVLSAAITVAVIAVIIAFNLLAEALTDRYSLSADMTGQKAFTLSAETTAYLQTLDADVDIYVLNSEQNFALQGSYFVQAAEILKQFGLHNDRVTVTFLDLMRNPGFTASFPELNLHSNFVLIVSGGETRLLDPEDLFHLQSDELGTYILSSKAEQAVTGAIAALTSGQTTYAAVLAGHNESPAAGLTEALLMNNYAVSTLNLAAQEIPAEMDLLVLSAPQADYSDAELRKLDIWLENGGNYGKTLFYLAAVDQPELPNLDAFLAAWGIAVEPGIVFETDYYYLGGNSWFLTKADYAESDYSRGVRRSGLEVYMPNSRPLADISVAGTGIRTTILLDFTESAGVRTQDSQLVDWTPTYEEVRGPFPALILSQRGWDTAVLPSNVLAASTSLAVEAGILEDSTYANSNYYLSLLSTLTGREDAIIIESKSLGGDYLGISYGQALLWGTIFFLVVPMLVLAAGGVMFLHRRHL